MNNVSNILTKLQHSGTLADSKNTLLKLIEDDPTNPLLYYQCGCIMNILRFYKEALLFYERGIEHGLSGEYLEDTYFRIGYTNIYIREFTNALTVLEEGLEAFPQNNGLKVLQALALYFEEKKEDSFETLMECLLTTTSDETIVAYRKELFLCLDLFKGDL